MRLDGCRLFFMIDFVSMIAGIYTISILSVERCIEVLDTQKRFSSRFKNCFTGLCLVSIWLFAVLFSLLMMLSFQSDILSDGSFSCQSTWTDEQMNTVFMVKHLFIFMLPFAIILVSSAKLLIFLVKWQRKMAKSKPANANTKQLSAFNFKTFFRTSK